MNRKHPHPLSSKPIQLLQAMARDAQSSNLHRMLISARKWFSFAAATSLSVSIATLSFTALSSGLAQAAALQAQPTQAAPTKFVPFSEFVTSLKYAEAPDYLARPEVKISDAASFSEMRQHLIGLYSGVDVKHSYVLDAQTFDCVPIEQQPGLRGRGISTIAAPPPADFAPASPRTKNEVVAPSAKLSQFPIDAKADAFGNSLGCEAHTIPMRRITLEEMSRFKNLKEFFQKGPNGAGQPSSPAKEVAPSVYAHKYSYTYQNVYNHGASTNINLWRPYVYTGSNEIFSLAQSWVIGDSWGTTQTAETGWQNYPAKYGSENPALFIYWTADGYNATGCYNLDCGAFVQTSSSLHLGAGFSNYSLYGSTQYEIQLQYYLYAGNWWLRVGGNWVGYYPGTVYRGGELTYYANKLEFGSESVGTTVWPAEGSGFFANSGYGWAGYQRLIYYSNLSNASIWTGLTAATPSPSCYTVAGPYYASTWGEYFYFGGPGGGGC
jgi:hypothetical protein